MYPEVYIITTVKLKLINAFCVIYVNQIGNFIGSLVNELKRTNRFKFKAGEKNYKMEGLYRSLYTTLNYLEKKKRRKETRPLNDRGSERGRKSEAFIQILTATVQRNGE